MRLILIIAVTFLIAPQLTIFSGQEASLLNVNNSTPTQSYSYTSHTATALYPGSQHSIILPRYENKNHRITSGKKQENRVKTKKNNATRTQRAAWSQQEKSKQITTKLLLGAKHIQQSRNKGQSNYKSPKRSKNGTYYRVP